MKQNAWPEADLAPVTRDPDSSPAVWGPSSFPVPRNPDTRTIDTGSIIAVRCIRTVKPIITVGPIPTNVHWWVIIRTRTDVAPKTKATAVPGLGWTGGQKESQQNQAKHQEFYHLFPLLSSFALFSFLDASIGDIIQDLKPSFSALTYSCGSLGT